MARSTVCMDRREARKWEMALAEVRRRKRRSRPDFANRSAQHVHRTPPHSAEGRSRAFSDQRRLPRETIAEGVEKINKITFTSRRTGNDYDVSVDLWNAGQALDLITFTQVLRDRICSIASAAAWRSSRFHVRSNCRRRAQLLPRDRSREYICEQIIFGDRERATRYESRTRSTAAGRGGTEDFRRRRDWFKGQMPR